MLLRLGETADRLKVTPQSVINFVERGVLRTAIPDLSRPLLFREEDVDAFKRDYLETPQWQPRGNHRYPNKHVNSKRVA